MTVKQTFLSGYKIVWVMVMFDLPVLTKAERKAANRFRLFLLDLGFERTQLSVYMRFCASRAKFVTCCKRVEANVPPGGKVNILYITDKQYEKIKTFYGGEKAPPLKKPDQFELF